MKEYALKHPILTFLLVDSAIAGMVNIVWYVINAATKTS